MGNIRFIIRLFSIAFLSFGSGMNIVALQFGLWFGWVLVAIGIAAFIYSTFPDRFIIKEKEENLIPLIYVNKQAKSHGMDFVGRNQIPGMVSNFNGFSNFKRVIPGQDGPR